MPSWTLKLRSSEWGLHGHCEGRNQNPLGRWPRAGGDAQLPASPVENSLQARVFVFCGFVVAAVAVAIYGQDYVVPAIGVVVAAIGHVVSYRGRNKRRSLAGQILVAGLVMAALAYFLADSVLAIFGGILPQANFAIVLVAVTSFDLKTRRNCYSSLWISLAILYLAAVYAWDYAFGILVALWAVCLAGFWMTSHLRRLDAKLAAPVRPVALALIGALALGLVFFIFIPQPTALSPTPLVVSLPNFAGFRGEMENPALPLVQISGDPSGATGSIDLHFRGRLGDAPVMYVRTGAPAYWRGLVFDSYEGGRWTASRLSFVTFQPYIQPRFLPPAPAHNLGTFAQVFRVVRTLPGVISAAYPIQSLYAPVAALRRDAYGTFRTPDVLRAGQTYSVVSYPPNRPAMELASDPLLPGYPENNTQYLNDNALSNQARQLAQQAVAGHTDSEFDKVMALTKYLQQHYQYSLQLGHVPPGRDPVDWFLFDAKIGYCEQFATAETLMLRSLGIPARLATGYSDRRLRPRARPIDSSRARRARVGGGVVLRARLGAGRPVARLLGTARHSVSQSLGGRLPREPFPHLSPGAPLAALGPLGILAVIPPAVAIALVVVVLWAWFRTRRWGRGVRAAPGESELLRLYENVQRRLKRRRAPPETPLEYQRAARAGPIEPLLDELTDAVNEGVYAGRWPEPDRVRDLTKQLR